MYATSAEQSRDAEVKALAERLYREHHAYLLRLAIRYAVDGDDGEEAVQFAFLAFIEHFDPAGKAPPLAWLTLVAKRECWAKRRAQHLDRRAGQQAERGGEGLDTISTRASGPAQLIEQVQNARARLGALKPAERRTLGLIAAGYSYAEVGEITGFSASEGRARLRKRGARLKRTRAPTAFSEIQGLFESFLRRQTPIPRRTFSRLDKGGAPMTIMPADQACWRGSAAAWLLSMQAAS